MKLLTGKFSWLLWIELALIMTAAACNYPTPDPPPVATPSAMVTSSVDQLPVLPTQTIEPAPLRTLVVCLTQEPNSLFPYGDTSSAARAVRQAIYDGPIDLVGYGVQQVLVENIPSLANGGALLDPMQVRSGDLIVDAEGRLTSLVDGVTYLPSGCREVSCASTYTGSEPVNMDQLTVRFTLREGISWSDGLPVTAEDSLYAYEVAQALFPQVRSELIQRTFSYRALDERSLEWRAVPGYLDTSYATNIFPPFPQHAWVDIPPEALATDERSARNPISWGPYVIDEWVAGDHITLSKNETYYRVGEGLPHFDHLVFRFIVDGKQALAALQAGECDLVDEAPVDYYDRDSLRQVLDAGNIAAFYEQDTAWEQLTFGIQPSDPGLPLYFGLVEVRQAVAQCIDRQRIVDSLAPGGSQVMHSYVPAEHPLFNPDAPRYAYDPVAGAAALQAAGWVDLDNDPGTPLQAQGVPGVVDGTPFLVELLTLVNSERDQVAGLIRDSLAGCGIGVEIRSMDAEELFAPGPEGEIFGRRFNLAQFGWPATMEPPCGLFTTAEIPGPYPDYPKGWGGANAAGYSREEFDRACLQARNSLTDDDPYKVAHRQAQAIFGLDLPVLPLYSRYRLVLARQDICGIEPDPSAESALWNLEQIDYGDGCT